jgi:glycosidase
MTKPVLVFFAFFFAVCSGMHAQVRRIEPLNWWVGMKNPNVQLLIYGEGIGETTPLIRYKGVTVRKVHRADSPNYLFVDVHITPKTRPGAFPIHFQKNGKTLFSQNYSLLPRQPGTDRLQGFHSGDVICLITPDRFANGDARNDVAGGMQERNIDRQFDGGRHGGDIRGIINSLDYLAGMGFTAIWSTPLLENDMPAYSYHGYAITDHYRVDPRFGTLDEYMELSEKARAKGLKLIFDGVVNHIGSSHWWMRDLPFKNWLNHPDTLLLTNHRRTVNQDIYASEFDKNLHTRGWFVPSMPDLNGQNPFMAVYLLQNSVWWIETLQLGGIRQDTYCYSDKDFLKKWSCGIMAEYPDFNIVGEEWSLNPLITSYWQQGKNTHDKYSGCLKSVMDFPLQAALVQALTAPEGSDFSNGMTRLYEALANDFIYADPQNILVFGDNHDMDRLFTQLNRDVDLTHMALTYLLTIRGIPQIYYGTEVLSDNSAAPNNHGVIRSDFPGGWPGDAANVFTGQGLNENQRRTQAFLKKMLNWRKSAVAVHWGKTLHFAPFSGVYVFFRYTPGQTVMVILNKNTAPVSVDLRRFEEILSGKATGRNVLSGESIPLDKALRVDGKSALVLEIN